jgi:hypothetical protein
MTTLRRWTPIACALLSIAAYTVAITCSAQAQSEGKIGPTESKIGTIEGKTAMLKVVSSHRWGTIPAPQSGIKLLEYITQKMKIKQPVIATRRQRQMYAAPQEENQGPTNPFLALKPPVNAYVPREPDRESVSDKKLNEESKARRKVESIDDRRADKDRNIAATDDNVTTASPTQRKPASARWEYAPNSWRKESAALPTAPASAPKADGTPYARAQRLAKGPLGTALANLGGTLQQVDSFQRAAESGSADQFAKAKSARAEANYRMPMGTKSATGIWDRGTMLATKPGFGNSANLKEGRMNTAGAGGAGDEQEPQQVQAQAPPLPASSYRNTRLPQSSMGKNIAMPGDNQYSANGYIGGSNIRDYKTQTVASASVPSAAPASFATPQGVPPPPPALTLNLDASSHFSTLSKKTEIAMLPPNVITGIPLVRLGSSADEANRALASVKGNKLNRQSISGWTVLVLHKANSLEPAMHVYMRHGLVEALRIFDNSFIAPDFGVQLNDDVQKVKAKFGEPAFMLPEPDCPTGAQNYVYPISQVSFELALPLNARSPKVVSVLIFTVK